MKSFIKKIAITVGVTVGCVAALSVIKRLSKKKNTNDNVEETVLEKVLNAPSRLLFNTAGFTILVSLLSVVLFPLTIVLCVYNPAFKKFMFNLYGLAIASFIATFMHQSIVSYFQKGESK